MRKFAVVTFTEEGNLNLSTGTEDEIREVLKAQDNFITMVLEDSPIETLLDTIVLPSIDGKKEKGIWIEV